MIFDVTTDLPEADLLLEASAGTGKTWTIAALVARYVAEASVPIDKLLILTFSRAAALELRGRIRSRLAAIADELVADAPRDPVAAHLAGFGRREAWIDRLRAAVAQFERANIATIHSFCQDQLRSLGVLGDWDDETLATDLRSLVRQCVGDEYLRRYLDAPRPPFDARRALRVAAEAAPSRLDIVADDREALSFHQAVRDAFDARRRQLGIVSFDDLVRRLKDLLTTSPIADLVRRELTKRFPFVLVDEFQDTDPDQWAILRCFVESDASTVVLIGDPKQSIYGFRSADLGCYLQAKKQLKTLTLGANYRSEPGIVRGVEELFGDVGLGPGIGLSPVEPARAPSAGVLELPGGPSARVWIRGLAPGGTEADITRDVVAQVAALLGSARIAGRAVAPGDIAVLTRTRDRAGELVAALTDAGIAAGLTGGEPVAVDDWLALLDAVAAPTRARVLAAAFGDLLGIEAALLLEKRDEAPASRRVHQLAAAFQTGGPPGLVAAVLEDLPAFLLDKTDGERRLAQAKQVGELLLTSGATTVPDLAAFLAGNAPTEPERLVSDLNAVRVGTMHSAKGLEFPIVLLPQVSVTDVNLSGAIPYIDASGTRVLHVGNRPRYRDELAAKIRLQSREEELRLLYVGLTRAKHLTIAWHLMDRRAHGGPLTALLCRDRSRPDLAPEYRQLPARLPFDSRLVHTSSALAPPWAPPEAPPSAPRQPLQAATFNRAIDTDWRRTSYTGLTAGLHELATDEPDVELIPEALEGPLAQPSPMTGLPAGTRFGTLVHEVLEAVDWSQAEAHLPLLVAERAAALGLDGDQQRQLAAALGAVVTTPLGGLFKGALADLPPAARLPELDFDLPLGDRGPAATVADLADVMAEHLPADDPLAPYPGRLVATDAADARLVGFLTGSIDAVLQLPDGRFLVVDYKTNQVPTLPDQELAVGHYTHAAMAEAMMQAHYPLQALLYSAALHRYLAWRLPGYAPEHHLGGVGYLFVRGMAGPVTPQVDGHRCGVFEWQPPTALTVAVSKVLGGERA